MTNLDSILKSKGITLPTKVCLVKAMVFPIVVYGCEFSSVQFSHSVVSDSATIWTVAYQAPLSMGFSRQEYWSGLPCPPPDLPEPGIKPASSAVEGEFLATGPPGKSLSAFQYAI